MAHCTLQRRLLCVFSILVSVASISGCRGNAANNARGENEQIDLSQNVTVNGRAQDVAFKDFEKNWRQFISTSPQLAIPIVGTPKREAPGQEPVVSSECVYNPNARAFDPKITLSWNESPAIAGRPALAQQPGQAALPVTRFDLALHHDAFARNYFSSAISTEKLKRFNLPSNSGLVNNPEAVLLTGPGLFPMLMDYKVELLQQRDTNLQVARQTVVLAGMNQGISYTMRVSRLANKEWSADRQFVFMVPMCPSSF
jgi:hypothetical protein